MQMDNQMDDIGFAPSFNCYASDSLTSKAAAKVSREFQDELSDVEEEDFEFSLEFAGEKYSAQELALSGRILLPIFDTDVVTKDEVESEVKELDDKTDSDSLIIPLEKLLISETGDPVSYSSEEAEKAEKEDGIEKRASKTFCVTWRKPRNHAAIKKSRSTGSESDSGSRKWRITDILRRSNSAGKESVFFLCPQRVEASNKKRAAVKSREGSNAGGKPKMRSSPSVHELFYVQKREEQKGDKKRSYLPYRQAILGFQVQVNGNANGNKKLPF
ncbi:hypothetical protein Tco_0776356 [Tanacetum coccineum]